ncbi:MULTISPECIES: peptidylprolyl isomerase [Pseudomonas syringae group]|uniref:Peptidyl-prolyl cis-trans isomerase n=1 Tax=Pseudomonas syringae pv. coryli TaxID=317659 RepID=A0A0P9SGL6_9PSED|nr:MULTISPECIES: peptidylprolyl isomerase [Pseudomonas syringae group]KPW97655.1 Peptidyl-prolyl cis-trans isomerase [Pseudomonas syringae pv. coryli]QQQ49375.1 peptidylprolyl isomerase [Pseudomonas syringae]
MLKKIALAACSVLFAANLMAAPDKATHVVLDTSFGQIEIELADTKAPLSTQNFLGYVDSGFYTNTIFHRVIPGFMVQGGGFTQQMVQKPTKAPIENEAKNGLHNVRGTIAMARTSVVNSATSQFFINTNDNAMLDNGARDFGYAVFGKVVKGMDVVDNIVNARTTTQKGMQNVPIDPILIKSAKRVN